MLLLLLACTPGDIDSAHDSGAVGARCPAGMAAVGDPEAPAFCVDAYEAVYEGELGSSNQRLPDAVPPAATARSAAPGELPSKGLSFDQARAICANSPVLDAAGELLGYRRLVRSQEWEDAGDGQLGEGGLTYPYGDTWDDEACVTLTADDRWREPQPAGTLERCVSPFGVYDLIGNLWEWADPGVNLDVGLALQYAEALGLRLDAEDRVFLDQPRDGRVRLEVAGVDPNLLTQEEDGRLIVSEVRAETFNWEGGPARGFILMEGAPTVVERWLSVHVEPLGELPGPAGIRVTWEDDGAPLTDKRGCAHYTGTANGCQLFSAYHGHVHDFDGSIGFRCVADPY
ncbi:MAG: SUMF1/EgtB/PvdO family nonheme iron enzyme [Alphaproteobacteria bacterium]|nr:SUMF1/EgtB/PvdO family nonheme iron enzyme [Alphaproteobacteria bacterium]MCB9792882.1 SUMF1/EgtB/PvdO family nonheme iron enzyme [Alphaproteobacteria bacterium]